MMKRIPMIAYAWADPHQTTFHQTREHREESRIRMWALVKYKTEGESGYSTAEFRYIIEHMPDFCGGHIIRSPQVITRKPSGYGADQFLSPGDSAGIGMNFTWADLTANPKRAIDLAALTGKEFWDESEVKEYGFDCMAYSAAMSLLYNSKRGFIAADKTTGVGGAMTRLVNKMVEMGAFQVPAQYIAFQGRIDDEATARNWVVQCVESAPRRRVRFVVPDTPDWFNANSGNPVKWYPITLEVQDEDGNAGAHGRKPWTVTTRCTPYAVPEAIRDCYNDREYVRGVPRKFWRNG